MAGVADELLFLRMHHEIQDFERDLTDEYSRLIGNFDYIFYAIFDDRPV